MKRNTLIIQYKLIIYILTIEYRGRCTCTSYSYSESNIATKLHPPIGG